MEASLCNDGGHGIECWNSSPFFSAENRMSGGVGGLTGAIPLARSDRHLNN